MAIKLGVVGLSKNGGWAAWGLIPPVLSKPLSDKYVLTAISASSPASAEATAEHYSELVQHTVRGYSGSTTAISADEDVDLVVVSVKVYEHKDAALPAIEAGKSVFVEWPLGKNLEEARMLAHAARERGIRTMVGTQSWFIPAFIKIKELIDSGRIGTVISTSWYATKDPDFRAFSPVSVSKFDYCFDETKGATYLDIMIGHHLSCVLRVLGGFTAVSATATTGNPYITLADSSDSPDARTLSNPLPDQFAVSGVLASGALFNGTWVTLPQPVARSQPALVWTIAGTMGQIRVEQRAPPPGGVIPQINAPDIVLLNDEMLDFKQENDAMTPVGHAWAAFATGGEVAVPTFEDAVELHQVIEAIRRSMKEGRRVGIDEV